MGRPDGVATERRHVDAVVEQLAVLDPRAARDRLERQRDPALAERPRVAVQLARLRGQGFSAGPRAFAVGRAGVAMRESGGGTGGDSARRAR